MRVLVIESTIFGYDGITNVIVNYYNYQDHKKILMDFVTINSVSESFKKKLNIYNSKNFVLPYRNRNPLKYVWDLYKIIKEGQYSVVHVHGCSATMAVEMLAAKLAGVKVRIAHSHNTTCDHVKMDKILRPLFFRWCNVGFACSEEAGEWMFPQKSFSVISNGVDLEKFQYNEVTRNQIREKYGLEKKFVIGHVGRFSAQKNHAKLIDIFAKLSEIYSEAKLVLIGEGELKRSIEQRTENENLDVLFVGLSNEVEKWLQAMDIIIFPSLFEGLPLGLIEAQASGLTCVLSDTISPAAKITDLVEFVKLDDELSVWCEVIQRNRDKFNRKARINNVKAQISKAHFDIKVNCRELEKRYELLIKAGGVE